jgi:hypothetical protein
MWKCGNVEMWKCGNEMNKGQVQKNSSIQCKYIRHLDAVSRGRISLSVVTFRISVVGENTNNGARKSSKKIVQFKANKSDILTPLLVL